MSYVFISHVEEDQDIARHISLDLEGAGFKAWYYERDSIPGPSYLTQILDAIEESAAIIVIISKDSIGSWQVDKEVIQVHECGKPFIPLLKDITHAEFRHRKPDWAMAMGAATSTPIPPEGVASIMPRIIAGLRWVGVPGAHGQQTAQPTQPATQAVQPPEGADPSPQAVQQPQTAKTPAQKPAASPGAPVQAALRNPSQVSQAAHQYAQPVPVVQPIAVAPGPSMPTVRQSVRDWERQHSLWMIWLLTLGTLNGIAFLWIGYRVQERKWVLYGFLYLLPFMLLITLGLTDSSLAGFFFLVMIGVFIGSLIHGFVVRRTYLWRLQQIEPPGMMRVS
jgi:TIR domain